MKFDTIIIGGGLSALTCGIRLCEQGQRVAIFAKGNSKLHYSSGSLELLGFAGGTAVSEPLKAIEGIRDTHPYHKLKDSAPLLAEKAAKLLADAGLNFKGTALRNHLRMTPVGLLKPAWLTLDEFLTFDPAIEQPPVKRVEIITFRGFLDFPAPFVEAGLKKQGIECHTTEISLPAIEKRRSNAYSLRATALSKVLADKATLVSLAGKLNSAGARAQAVVLPAVIGSDGPKGLAHLQKLVTPKIMLVPTLPPSVPGERIHTQLRKRFTALGGTFMLASAVKNSVIEGDTVSSVFSVSLPDQSLTADNYVLASGSFMSGGLVATNHSVIEPVFGCDTEHGGNDRALWTTAKVFEPQPYMAFGVKTDGHFRALKDGKPLKNLYAIGSILSGHNSVKEGDDSGVAILTALQVAKILTE